MAALKNSHMLVHLKKSDPRLFDFLTDLGLRLNYVETLKMTSIDTSMHVLHTTPNLQPSSVTVVFPKPIPATQVTNEDMTGIQRQFPFMFK